jgi:ParB family chromosome partitioning protein
MTKLVNLKLDEIFVGEGVRKTVDEDSIKELSASFAKHGVLQPVVVQPRDGGYELLIGARRFMAARQAGLDTIPALVLDEALKPDEAIEAKLIENLQREDLDPLDEAEAYQALKEMGYSLTAIGKRLGKSRPYVSQRVKLLRLHPKLREAVRHRTLTPDHAQAIMRLKDPEQQLALAQEAQSKGLSVHETRQRVRQMLGKELKWRLVPLRLNPETFEALKRIAPEGDVKRLIRETIEKLIKTS